MKILLAIAAMVAAVEAGPAKADEILRFGIAEEPNPPFTIKDTSGAWTGWEVEIRDAVCRKMGSDCQWVETGWDDLVPALRARKFDVIWSSLPITDERRKLISFTDTYYALPVAIAGPRESVATAELTDKTIGVQASTTALAYASAHYGAVARQIKIYDNQDDADQDLAAGRIDVDLADAITISAFLATDLGKACCKLLQTLRYDPKTLGQGFAAGLRPDDTALRDRLNAAIKAIRASGEYNAITAKYFGFDIYGQ